MSIARLVATTQDKREVVRNEAILLLVGLTDGNADIQKLVAFENAFEVLFDIIAQEEGVSGGIVVHDCLQLLSNLLRFNPSNQTFFRETRCVPRLCELLQIDVRESWPSHRIQNVKAVLSVSKWFSPRVPSGKQVILLNLCACLICLEHAKYRIWFAR